MLSTVQYPCARSDVLSESGRGTGRGIHHIRKGQSAAKGRGFPSPSLSIPAHSDNDVSFDILSSTPTKRDPGPTLRVPLQSHARTRAVQWHVRPGVHRVRGSRVSRERQQHRYHARGLLQFAPRLAVHSGTRDRRWRKRGGYRPWDSQAREEPRPEEREWVCRACSRSSRATR